MLMLFGSPSPENLAAIFEPTHRSAFGFEISERTVARYVRRIHRRGDPKRSWLTFLKNHREVIAALDFFTVPTITFQLLYCFFVIDHQRRKILHCNVTAHPTGDWVIQQLRIHPSARSRIGT